MIDFRLQQESKHWKLSLLNKITKATWYVFLVLINIIYEFQAEEKAELNQEILTEKKEAVKQLEIESIEHSANEDNIMERMRYLNPSSPISGHI